MPPHPADFRIGGAVVRDSLAPEVLRRAAIGGRLALGGSGPDGAKAQETLLRVRAVPEGVAEAGPIQPRAGAGAFYNSKGHP